MRNINRIILNCSATPEGRYTSANEIRKWHVNGNGWSDIGYHYVIRIDGTIEKGRPISKPGAHTRGHNKDSIGVVYVGGCDADMNAKDTMTSEQNKSFRMLVMAVRTLFAEETTIHGHNEFSSKSCPSFKVDEKFNDMI